MNRHLLIKIMHFVGVAIFVVILSRLDLSELWRIILSLNPFYLSLSIIAQILTNLLKSERWRMLLSFYQDFRFLQVLKINVYGSLYAAVTPGKLGVGFMAPLIKNSTLSYSQIFFSIIVDRLLDVITIILTGYFGFVFLADAIAVDKKYLLVVTVALVIFFFFAYYIIRRSLKKSRDIIAIENKTGGRIERFYSKLNLIRHNILNFTRDSSVDAMKIICKVIIINLLAFFFYYITIYFAALSLGLNISYMFIVLSYSVVTLLGMLPVSISGIGTRDISLIFFFNILGISAEKAIALSFIDLIIMNYGIILLLLLILNIGRFITNKGYLIVSPNKVSGD
jgi:glycosyltransferase 2 family protein